MMNLLLFHLAAVIVIGFMCETAPNLPWHD